MSMVPSAMSYARRARLAVATLFIGLMSQASVRADVVDEWNQTAANLGYTARTGNALHIRNMALVDIAVFEALNAITPRYRPYRPPLIQTSREASAEAAAATAAHAVLAALYPRQKGDLDQQLQTTLSRIGPSSGRALGVGVGETAARAVLTDRANDGSSRADAYRPHTTPGQYVPTVLPLASHWGSVRPFAMKSGDAFRPPPPPSLNSEEWARDYNEVRIMGARTGSTRNESQNEIARFWEFSGPATYNPVVRQVAQAKGLDLLDKARLFALVSIATADAAVAVFDAKYTYAFWRPITAIRNGDQDGNDATERVPTWEPLIATPMHPEYPCAHCIFQSATASVLTQSFGDVVPTFTLTSPTAPGVKRSYDRLSSYVSEVVEARILEGVHYRNSGRVGADMGRRLGELVAREQLQPAR